MSSLPVERKTLQTLQLSAEQGCLTRPGQQLKHKVRNFKNINLKYKIYMYCKYSMFEAVTHHGYLVS